jgi:hypothetical protein
VIAELPKVTGLNVAVGRLGQIRYVVRIDQATSE